jgi:hypothetical protein
MQLNVTKADGSVEQYLHTKVLGTISNALSGSDLETSFVAEQLADAITFYLYNKHTDGSVTSSEIYYMIQAMLNATGYDQASLSLNNYHFTRELMRRRVEVVDTYTQNAMPSNWNKSQIASDLIDDGIERATARAIASMVEEKVLKIGMSRVPRSLIKQLVEIETQAMLQAQEQLEIFTDTAVKKRKTILKHSQQKAAEAVGQAEIMEVR